MANETTHTTGIRIRQLAEADAAAVERLAQLDSAEVPAGPLLGAEIEGRLLAVTSLSEGVTVADPFSRGAELRDLLDLRAAQLRQRQPRRRRFGAGAGRPARAALAGSPPGAGGRLLSLRPY
ncbi:MAG: hypothetical protein M3383_03170 [Actinomycetota bacterium]|nr:hypothetical protein [Actinomycetota bacterium]